jgi:hypothetical protein
MDLQKILDRALEIQATESIALTTAINKAVVEHLRAVAGTWTAQAERLHTTDVVRLAQRAGHTV